MIERDDVLDGVADALGVEPSARFADGVQKRISAHRLRRWSWRAFAASSAAVVAFIVLKPLVDVAPVPASVVRIVPPVAVVSANDSASVERRTVPPARVSERNGPFRSPALGKAPRFEVITNQMEVLRAAWQGWSGGTAIEVVIDEPADGPGPVIDPVVVEAISVAPVVVNEIIIRREEAAQEP